MAFSPNAKRRKTIERTTHSMTDEQQNEFYRLLFDEGGDVAREYREQFAETRTIPPDPTT